MTIQTVQTRYLSNAEFLGLLKQIGVEIQSVNKTQLGDSEDIDSVEFSVSGKRLQMSRSGLKAIEVKEESL